MLSDNTLDLLPALQRQFETALALIQNNAGII
jgi:hypothetical protein